MAVTLTELTAQNLEHFLITNPIADTRVLITTPFEYERLVPSGESADVYILSDHEGPYEGPFDSAKHYLIEPNLALKYPALTRLVRLHLASSRYRSTILIPELLDIKLSLPQAPSIGSLLADYAGKNIRLFIDPRRFGLASEPATGWVIGLESPLPIAEAIQSAFKDRFIASEDHSVLQKWMRF